MNQEITNLKRQITARRLNAVERAMEYLLANCCRFRCDEEPAPSGHIARYVLYADNRIVGSFDWFANGSRPDVVLGRAWQLSGARRPWLDEEDSSEE